MTTQESLKYLIDKALKYGYTERQIKCFEWELKERLNSMEETDEEDILKLFDEIF